MQSMSGATGVSNLPLYRLRGLLRRRLSRGTAGQRRILIKDRDYNLLLSSMSRSVDMLTWLIAKRHGPGRSRSGSLLYIKVQDGIRKWSPACVYCNWLAQTRMRMGMKSGVRGRSVDNYGWRQYQSTIAACITSISPTLYQLVYY